MRERVRSIRRRRPSTDPLEDRYLLSADVGPFTLPAPAAFVSGFAYDHPVLPPFLAVPDGARQGSFEQGGGSGADGGAPPWPLVLALGGRDAVAPSNPGMVHAESVPGPIGGGTPLPVFVSVNPADRLGPPPPPVDPAQFGMDHRTEFHAEEIHAEEIHALIEGHALMPSLAEGAAMRDDLLGPVPRINTSAPKIEGVVLFPRSDADHAAPPRDALSGTPGGPVPCPPARVSGLLALDPRGEGRPAISTPQGGDVEPALLPTGRAGSADLSRKVVAVDVPAAPPPALGKAEAAPLVVPPPRGLGLIAEAAPADSAPMQDAVDRFLDSLEDLGVGRLDWEGPERPVPVSLGLLIAATTFEVARRRLKRASEERAAPRDRGPARVDLFGFPELPGPWSTRVT